MKGISPVIAIIILLLLVTISIIGFTSVFFQQHSDWRCKRSYVLSRHD
ncbi:MAG: hypothetical protein HY364_02255 [Candidatus Aenigmarchaeota archaeon]|nr:hypothetical protein [Candidatus Aenigmarchaeota archaeon]